MKKILTLLGLFLAEAFHVAAQTSSYWYGYCDKDMARGSIQSLSAKKSNVNFYCFIHLTAEDATLLAGNEITKVTFSLGYCSATSVKVIISATPEGEALYSQSVAVSMLKWNTATLTSPYKIESGKELYIGYEVVEKYSFDAPVDVVKDNTFGNTNGDIIGQGTSRAAATWSHSSQNGYGNLCILALIEGESLPTRNATLSTTGLEGGVGYVQANTAFAIVGTVKNSGLDKITSFTTECRIDDSDAVTTEHTCSIAHDSTTTFSIPELSVLNEGQHSATVTITKVNGEEDQSTGDNTLTFTFASYNNVYARNAMVEFFTSQTCTNCDAGHAAVESALEDHDNAILVAHHSGFADDVFTSEWDASYTWFFPSSGNFNPGVMFDRTNINEVTLQNDDAPVVFPYNNRCKDYLAYALAQPAFATVSVEGVYDATTGIITATVTTEGNDQYVTSDSLRINLWLVEDSLLAAQKMSDGTISNTFVHNGVMRQSFTGTWGEKCNLNGTHEYSAVMPTAVKDPINCRLVAFLSKYDSKDNNKSKVLNSKDVKLTSVSGISSPTPIPLPCGEGSRYNLNGQKVNEGYHGIIIKNGVKIINVTP